jgi:hypothetical protein
VRFVVLIPPIPLPGQFRFALTNISAETFIFIIDAEHVPRIAHAATPQAMTFSLQKKSN